jgi:uncharacterized Zn-binding protein involved in type VI secretion
MGLPAAKQGDRVVATDLHLIQPPGTSPPVLVPHPFDGTIGPGCVADVLIEGRPAAVVGATAINRPHLPIGGSFVVPPRNQGRLIKGSGTVMIGGKPAVRTSDPALTCNDPADAAVGQVVATGTVLIGD